MPTKPPMHNPRPHKGKQHETKEAARLRKWRSGARWQRLRRKKLGHHPLCENCFREGRIATPATQVHHIEPAAQRPDLFFVLVNLESICTRCHAKESVRERMA